MTNKEERSILLSLIIGDGHLGDNPNKYKKRITKMGQIIIKHGDKQKDYLLWKAEIISKLWNQPINIKPCISYVKSTNKSYQQHKIQISKKKLRAWKKIFYKNKEKQIGKILKFTRHPAFTAAVWLMDDGSATKSTKPNGTIVFCGLVLYICDQDRDNCKEIIEWWERNFNVKPKIKWQKMKYKGTIRFYPNIRFNNLDSLKIYSYIRPFIQQIPSMMEKFQYLENRFNRRDLQQP